MLRISKWERNELVKAGLIPGEDIIRPKNGKNYYLVERKKNLEARNKVYGIRIN